MCRVGWDGGAVGGGGLGGCAAGVLVGEAAAAGLSQGVGENRGGEAKKVRGEGEENWKKIRLWSLGSSAPPFLWWKCPRLLC